MAFKHWQGVSRGGLLVALLALASCGGSGGGRGYVALAPVPPGVPAPCAAAFDPPGTGLGQANTSPHDSEAPAGTSLASRMLSASIRAATQWMSPAYAQGQSQTDLPVINLSVCREKHADANGNITIGEGGCGPHVVIDKDFTEADGNALGKLTITKGGKLAVPYALEDTRKLETRGITVASEGVLSLGTKVCPVGSADHPNARVQVTFIGEANSQDQGHAGHSSGSGSDKGIEVQSGGTLRLYGAKGVGENGVNWTHLSEPAGPTAYQDTDKGIGAPVADGGERRLHLANDVAAGGWREGDWIVVATSSFSPFESEFVQIDAVTATSGDTSIVTLRQPLRHYHFGGKNPGLAGKDSYRVGADRNFGVDERTEVGLISRSITLTARTPAAPPPIRPASAPVDPYLHWGGEIRILDGFTEVGIQGVELEKFGKARLGSYPIHFHLANDAVGKHLVDSNSIHHSYNKCVTVHQTQGVTISNSVCARAVGHLFYQEIAKEQGGSFKGNLGIGAQSHHFGLADAVPKVVLDEREPQKLWPANWWEGDHLARANGYDSLNIRNMDAQDNPMRGACYEASNNHPGELVFSGTPNPSCSAAQFYVEPPSGFWIGNPGTVLEGNSIAGCQGMGKGYWYVPPQPTAKNNALGLGRVQHEPVGRFLDNRVHGCYDGLFFGEQEGGMDMAPLLPRTVDDLSLVGRFQGLTATRIRNRGVWVRPVWYSIENSRFATNRQSVTLVTSGGADGSAPGAWGLLKDSVMVGVSTNNVDRWGPCPANVLEGRGCVDRGGPGGHNSQANEFEASKSYQTPYWNSFGYTIYDGPVRLIDNHFVNFLVDPSPLLTLKDRAFLKGFGLYSGGGDKYEGDAALGWFQGNQSAYPTSSVTKGLSFHNVDLRHQIYTDNVNLGDFKDGDKNTAVIDLDGSLTGYRIVDKQGNPVPDEYPISLNNLPFNRNGNAVDECLAEGAQDQAREGRPTSLISPANMASLEFEALRSMTAGGVHWQDMLFSKDSKDAGVHQTMQLQSRNGLGVWEPKVAHGFGYSVRAVKTTTPGIRDQAAYADSGMPRQLQVGLTDAVKSRMDKDPFYVRVGICYTDKTTGGPPKNDFTLVRGYKSWGGGGVNATLPEMRPYFNFYDGKPAPDGRLRPSCFNVDGQNPNENLLPGQCPAQGEIPLLAGGGCPAGATQEGNQCIFKKQTFTQAQSIKELTDETSGKALATDKYFYDAARGMLYFYVAQNSPNAQGKAPLASCVKANDPTCPGEGELDSYYPCPPEGCTTVMVTLNDPSYVPGEAKCNELVAGGIYGNGAGDDGATMPDPMGEKGFLTHRLGYVGESGAGAVVKSNPTQTKPGFLHWTPERPAACLAPIRPVNAGLPGADVLARLRAQMQAQMQAARTQMRTVSQSFAPPPKAPAVDIQALAQSQICTSNDSAMAGANGTTRIQ